MPRFSITPHGLATAAGGLILAAAANIVIVKSGGYLTSHALLVSGLAVGVFAASWCLGKGVVRVRLAKLIVTLLLVGEVYSVVSMAERLVIVREEAQALLLN